jgi:HTH-type transcriptional regulator/antitoxin HigA
MKTAIMEEHGIAPSGLPEIGPESDVTDILTGRREASLEQIRALAKRFHVSPAVFL